MREVACTLKQSRPLTADTWELILSGDSSDLTRPGQFVNIELPGKFLRRPISVCDWGENTLTLLVRIAGAGSRALTEAAPGTVFSVLSGLGNGFDPSDRGTQPILIGGGVGTAPLYRRAGLPYGGRRDLHGRVFRAGLPGPGGHGGRFPRLSGLRDRRGHRGGAHLRLRLRLRPHAHAAGRARTSPAAGRSVQL